ncbi:magnesium chelatase [Pueribacillus theae]|uniref:Magnesium chelatase n=1 Tax=Pueribacillus theae TaxID=2171751 RepID=A0A2U1JRX6_9BACI|nr:MoxR family ATPase [Pueribacillus theae]PWA07921.1 magnesium chelatase [Pueribacillus theae]
MGKSNVNVETNDTELDKLFHEVSKVVIGRKKELKLLFTALLAEGHVLLEDLPGTGKTTMVKAFAKVLDCRFSRIQCTPDLLPSDVVGGSIFNPKTNEFYLRKGPIFTNVLLVDEINRALPRTQSSLLECMEEGQVSIEGETHHLPKPFIVLATQNPIDMEGTFPLPEAQLDRFLMRLKLGYPSLEEEEQMLELVGDFLPYEQVQHIFDPEKINVLQQQIKEVVVHPSIREYIIALASATRSHPLVSVGVSPRASKALYKTVKTWAFLNHRNFVSPDDVKEMVIPVWNHRLFLNTEARMQEAVPEKILNQILQDVHVPEERVVRV